MMRSEEEIQRTHDILHAVATGEVHIEITDETRIALHAALDTLCWILRHDHNQDFITNLARIEALIHAAGYKLERHRVN